MIITFQPKKVAIFPGMIIVLLIVANLAGIVSKFYFGSHRVALFDLDREGNIPTLYAAVTLLLSAGLLALIAVAKKRQETREYLYWAGLALIFLFLSVNDSAALHENVIRPLRNALNTSGVLYFAWVIPYGIFVLTLGIAYFRFLFSLPVKLRNLMIVAGLLYIGGTLGGEMLGGYWTNLHGQEDITFALITTCEESLEMVGVLVLIYALMSYISSELNELFFHTGSSGGPLQQDVQESLKIDKSKAALQILD